MKNIKKIFAALVVTSSFAAPSMAADLSSSSQQVNAAQNTQTNSGSVNLAPMGGSNANYQINSVSNSQFGFGPGIQCPTPELAIGASSGQSNGWGGTPYYTSGNSLGVTAMFTMPIGGRTAEYCKNLVKEIALQRKLDTKINMIKQCAALAGAGIQLDVEKFPEFKLCAGVTVASGKSAILEEPKRVFTPEETVLPVIPINKQ